MSDLFFMEIMSTPVTACGNKSKPPDKFMTTLYISFSLNNNNNNKINRVSSTTSIREYFQDNYSNRNQNNVHERQNLL